MQFWKDKRVLVTGGAGFIGSYVVELLVDLGARVKVADLPAAANSPNLEKVISRIEFFGCDLMQFKDCVKACQDSDILLNLAAKVGDVNFNNLHPGTMFHDNILMNTYILEAARLNKVERFLVVSSACVYPRSSKAPTPESEGFSGLPDQANEGYGWAKRMAEFQAQAYTREFGMKIGIVRPYNAYGPRDYFDASKGHVIAALIKRIFDNENPLKVWGSGEQARSFLYATDFARGILAAAEKYAVCDPLNLGSDEEIKIKDLVALIIRLSGKKVEVVFDTAKPQGEPRRTCDITKAREKIGFQAQVKLETGIKNTIDWYLAHKEELLTPP